VLGLLSALGIPLPDGFTVTQPKMRRQADELSEEWVRLYNESKVAEVGGLPGKV
jgi:LPS sulfotransferase NodH